MARSIKDILDAVIGAVRSFVTRDVTATAAWGIQDILRPTTIGRIDHFLDDLDGDQSLQYNLEVRDQFGDVMAVRSGNEAPYLTSQQIAQLRAFMTARRANLPDDLTFTQGHQLGRCTWRFRDLDGSTGGRALHVRAVELDGQGQFVRVHQADDAPNLTQPMIDAALAFLDAQRSKAESEIIP